MVRVYNQPGSFGSSSLGGLFGDNQVGVCITELLSENKFRHVCDDFRYTHSRWFHISLKIEVEGRKILIYNILFSSELFFCICLCFFSSLLSIFLCVQFCFISCKAWRIRVVFKQRVSQFNSIKRRLPKLIEREVKRVVQLSSDEACMNVVLCESPCIVLLPLEVNVCFMYLLVLHAWPNSPSLRPTCPLLGSGPGPSTLLRFNRIPYLSCQESVP